jgi:SAM-dependent methyltransferase
LGYLLGLEGIALLRAFAGEYDRNFTMARLAEIRALGHTVIGVDSSAAMLEHAREKVPGGEFHEADLHDLPLPDDHVDIVICALALMHVPDIEPVLAELVRGLRPGGSLVISDWRILIGDTGLPVVKVRPDGSPATCRPGAGAPAITLRLLSASGYRCAGAKNLCGHTRWLTPAARPTGARCQITSPALRRPSGRCIAGVPPPLTPRIAASPSPSSGTSNSAKSGDDVNGVL